MDIIDAESEIHGQLLLRPGAMRIGDPGSPVQAAFRRSGELTQFFGILLDRDVPQDRGKENCAKMARAFSQETFVHHSMHVKDRLCVGFAVPHRIAGRLGKDRLLRQGDGLTLFGDVTLYNRSSIEAGLRPSPRAGIETDISLLHGHARRGGDPAGLNGDFAFGIYDEGEQRLRLLRDQIGSRILYYARRPEGLLFSTRIHAFFQAGFDRSDLDPMALASFLVMRFPGAGKTYYPSIFELEPAHVLDVQPDRQANSRRYWSLQPDPDLRFRRSEDWIEHIRSVFVTAVTSRLRDAERPGIKLSGGLDSSSVAGVMCAENPDRQIRAFAHIPGQAYPPIGEDDAPFLRAMENEWGNLDVTRVRSDRFDLLSGSHHWDHVAASPCPDAFQFAEDALTEAIIDQDVDVVLSGYAGDDCFSVGSHAVLIDLMTHLNFPDAWTEFKRLRMVRGLSAWQIVRWRLGVPLLPAALRNAILAAKGKPWQAGYAVNQDYLRDRDFTALLNAEGFDPFIADPHTVQDTMLQNIAGERSPFVAFGDRFHWGTGYRSRLPLLDIELLRAIVSAPARLMVSNQHDRALIRQVASPFLPEPVRIRTGKAPFVPDYFCRFAPRIPDLLEAFSRFEGSTQWAAVVDEKKVTGYLKAFGDDDIGKADFAKVVDIVMMPYFAGCFLDSRENIQFTGFSSAGQRAIH